MQPHAARFQRNDDRSVLRLTPTAGSFGDVSPQSCTACRMASTSELLGIADWPASACRSLAASRRAGVGSSTARTTCRIGRISWTPARSSRKSSRQVLEALRACRLSPSAPLCAIAVKQLAHCPASGSAQNSSCNASSSSQRSPRGLSIQDAWTKAIRSGTLAQRRQPHREALSR